MSLRLEVSGGRPEALLTQVQAMMALVVQERRFTGETSTRMLGGGGLACF